MMKKLLIITIVLSLCSCEVWYKVAGTGYWEETCKETIGVYDSTRIMPKQFMQGQKSMVFMTDTTDERVCTIIWGDSCDLTPGDSVYALFERAHAPGAGTAYWKPYLINQDTTLKYIIFD